MKQEQSENKDPNAGAAITEPQVDDQSPATKLLKRRREMYQKQEEFEQQKIESTK